jgi:hypothetical protein
VSSRKESGQQKSERIEGRRRTGKEQEKKLQGQAERR